MNARANIWMMICLGFAALSFGFDQGESTDLFCAAAFVIGGLSRESL